MTFPARDEDFRLACQFLQGCFQHSTAAIEVKWLQTLLACTLKAVTLLACTFWCWQLEVTLITSLSTCLCAAHDRRFLQTKMSNAAVSGSHALSERSWSCKLDLQTAVVVQKAYYEFMKQDATCAPPRSMYWHVLGQAQAHCQHPLDSKWWTARTP